MASIEGFDMNADLQKIKDPKQRDICAKHLAAKEKSEPQVPEKRTRFEIDAEKHDRHQRELLGEDF